MCCWVGLPEKKRRRWSITGRWSTRLMRIEPTRNTPESENVEACPHRTRGARLLVRESLSAPALPMWVYDSPWR
jgi:hypothetical protein